MKPDFCDALATTGLVLLAVGLGMIDLSLMLIVIGSIVLLLAVFLASRRRR